MRMSFWKFFWFFFYILSYDLLFVTVLTVTHIANHYNNFETLNNMSVATKFRYVQTWLTFKILLDDILGAAVCFYI